MTNERQGAATEPSAVGAGGGPEGGNEDRLGRLLEKVERIERVLDRVEPLTRALDQLPGQIAILVDALDDEAARFVDEGIDLDTSLRQGLKAALWLGEHVSARELERFGLFLRSDILEPHALTVIGTLGQALATCHERACETPAPERLGALGLIKALNDPEVQRAAAFAIQVARCLGRSLADAESIETASCTRTES